MTRFELVTSSLPRKRSTPELHRRKVFNFLFSQKQSFFDCIIMKEEIPAFAGIFERETRFELATFSLEG